MIGTAANRPGHSRTGGAGLGFDGWDRSELALTLAGTDAVELIVEDNRRRPDSAAQLSAIATADAADQDASCAGLEAAEFDSVRGKVAFGQNHHPARDFHVLEAIRESDVIADKIIGTAPTDRGDTCAGNCGR